MFVQCKCIVLYWRSDPSDHFGFFGRSSFWSFQLSGCSSFHSSVFPVVAAFRLFRLSVCSGHSGCLWSFYSNMTYILLARRTIAVCCLFLNSPIYQVPERKRINLVLYKTTTSKTETNRNCRGHRRKPPFVDPPPQIPYFSNIIVS